MYAHLRGCHRSAPLPVGETPTYFASCECSYANLFLPIDRVFCIIVKLGFGERARRENKAESMQDPVQFRCLRV